MTGTELMDTVARMGFEKTLDDNEVYFYRAANMALLQLTRIFPLFGCLALTHTDGENYFTDYDIESLKGDFRAFPDRPIRFGSLLLTEGRDYLLDGSRIRLMSGRGKGELEIRYLRRPKKLSPNTKEEEIDLPQDAVHLLPLLIASYLWVDDRAELASYYMGLYRTELAEARRTRYAHAGGGYQVTNGWDKG